MASAPAITADPIEPAADPVVAPAAVEPPAPANDGGDPPAPAADDWRTRLSGGDEKLNGYLARVPSEKALVERVKKHEEAIKQGKYLTPVGEDSTDEEVAAWRSAMGVPEKPEGYLEKLPEGLVVGDDDKPFVDKFLTDMHAAGARPADVNAALDAYYAIVDEQATAELEATTNAKKACEDALREEWAEPGEYRRNDNVLKNYVGSLPEAVRDAFDKGIGPDGVPLGYNPEIRRWLVSRALDENPYASVVPGAGANQATAIADEIKAIEKQMREDRKGYFKDDKMQARYLELTTARDKMAG